MTHVSPQQQFVHAIGTDPHFPIGTSSNRQAGALAADEEAVSPVFAGRKRRSPAVKTAAVMMFSAGIVTTLALPANAVAPAATSAGSAPVVTLATLKSAGAQQVTVSADVEPAVALRDDFDATTMEELEEKRQREREAREREARERAEREAAEQREQEAAAAASSQPAAAPAPAPAAAAAPSANGGSIVDVARQYLGVPYVFGGASPSGFDCSGLTMYVYAQFGISLPHSSAAQGAGGTRVSNPQPGDLVIIDGGSHVGIYTGGGNMIDAPMPGRVVNERPIYSGNHFFVRY